ncbi:MAG: DUF1848 domain-containing protein [Oscillospiraceae bacterium]|jgi:hypothetical protein
MTQKPAPTSWDSEKEKMIINTGQRTDIPAFYSKWFLNRVLEGYALSRNPYNPSMVTRYRFDPETVDAIMFCTKDPAPMIPHLAELSAFRQIWYMTITPYGTDIEPHVPGLDASVGSFRRLSLAVSPQRVIWRYDPVIITGKYTVSYHKEAFEKLCEALKSYTHSVVVSFVDLYEKTKRNFPGIREVSPEERLEIGRSFAQSAVKCGMKPYTCLEGTDLEQFGFDCSGCMTKEVIERAIGEQLRVPSGVSYGRPGCRCLIGCDIGAYNTCGHGCLYCYANYDMKLVGRNMKLHDPDSPFLIGGSLPGDTVHDAVQESWLTGQTIL